MALLRQQDGARRQCKSNDGDGNNNNNAALSRGRRRRRFLSVFLFFFALSLSLSLGSVGGEWSRGREKIGDGRQKKRTRVVSDGGIRCGRWDGAAVALTSSRCGRCPSTGGRRRWAALPPLSSGVGRTAMARTRYVVAVAAARWHCKGHHAAGRPPQPSSFLSFSFYLDSDHRHTFSFRFTAARGNVGTEKKRE